jgi:hypothetical protein
MSPLSGQRQQSGTEVHFLEVLPFFEGLWEKNTVETNSSITLTQTPLASFRYLVKYGT